MSVCIEVRDLATTTPDGLPLSQGLNFDVRTGELVTIAGDNGAGKTTLARSVLGLHRRYKGKVSLNLKIEEIAYLPQLGNVQFFLPLTLHDVIELKGNRATEEVVGIGLLDEHVLNRPWNSASGGERQRAMLTRIFLSNAKLLVLDEPYNHLDRVTRQKVEDILRERLRQGAAVLMISHSSSGELRATREIFLKRERLA